MTDYTAFEVLRENDAEKSALLRKTKPSTLDGMYVTLRRASIAALRDGIDYVVGSTYLTLYIEPAADVEANPWAYMGVRFLARADGTIAAVQKTEGAVR